GLCLLRAARRGERRDRGRLRPARRQIALLPFLRCRVVDRRMRRLLFFLILVAVAASPARSQNYPARPVHIIAPWPPTGTVAILARVLGQKLADNLGQPVLVENRAGANGVIGSDAVAKATPDGYTLLVDNVTGHSINATLRPNMPFDSVR